MYIAVRDEKFSISPTIIVALTVFGRRAFSIAPPAVECILFANRNETDGGRVTEEGRTGEKNCYGCTKFHIFPPYNRR